MKKLLLFLLAGSLSTAAVGQNPSLSGSTWTFTANNFVTGIVWNGATASPRPVAPGDKIVINFATRCDYFEFQNLVGTLASPIVITNAAGLQIVQGGANGSKMDLIGCRNVIIRGDFDGTVPVPTNTTDTIRYGFKFDNMARYWTGINAAKPASAPTGVSTGGIDLRNCRNITIDRVGIYNTTFIGVRANQQSDTLGVLRLLNSKISGTWLEAVYWGNTDLGTPSRLDSARIENCVIENTWNNAVQFSRLVSGGQGIVRNTTFRNISVNQNANGQVGGVTWGQDGAAVMENCTFENVNGQWAMLLNNRKIRLRNNVVRGSHGVFWNNLGATDTLIYNNNTVVMQASVPFSGFNAQPFNSQTTLFVNQASPGRVIYRDNLTVNTTPSPVELNSFASGIATTANNYYATALGAPNGFVSTVATLAIPNARATGWPSFTPDVRLNGATPPGRGFDPNLLLWPSVTQAPPSAPGFPSFSSITSTSATATFTAATTTGSITRYRAFLNGIKLADSTANLTRSLTGLNAANTYSFAVQAVDNLGQAGPQNVNSFTTLGTPDPQRPSRPGFPVFSNIGVTTATATASTASTDNVGVVRYVWYVNNIARDSTAGRVVNFTGLTASSSFDVSVESVDAAGNRSLRSSAANFATLANPNTTVDNTAGAGLIRIITPGRTIVVRKEAFSFDIGNGILTIYLPGQAPLILRTTNVPTLGTNEAGIIISLSLLMQN